MNMQKYLRAVRRRLNMPRELKDRVMSDYLCAITAKQESGQTDDAIMEELGSPKKAAAELNEQMKAYTYRKSPWRWVCLAVAVFSGLCLAYRGLLGLLLMLFNRTYNAASSIGIIGGADGPTAIFVTTTGSNLSAAFALYILLMAAGILGYFVLRKQKQK